LSRLKALLCLGHSFCLFVHARTYRRMASTRSAFFLAFSSIATKVLLSKLSVNTRILLTISNTSFETLKVFPKTFSFKSERSNIDIKQSAKMLNIGVMVFLSQVITSFLDDSGVNNKYWILWSFHLSRPKTVYYKELKRTVS